MADSGFFAQTTFTASAAQTAFLIGFPALNSSHLVLTIDGTASSSFNVTGDLTAGSGTLNYTGTALAGGEIVVITRTSPATFALLTFQSANADPATAADFDELVKALLYQIQESADDVVNLDLFAVRTITASAAALAGDEWIEADASGGAVTYTLEASPVTGDWRRVANSGATGAVTVDGNGKNINGASTTVLSSQHDTILLAYNGTEWRVL